MKKLLLLFSVIILFSHANFAQTTPIGAEKMAFFNVPGTGGPADSLLPYYGDLGVRRVIVADADGDGTQEILATDYTNGGRVHVMKVVQDSLLEIIWSSPVYESSSGSSPRFIQVGDCDGDGNKEIVFPQANIDNNNETFGRIALFEWNGTDWGDEPAFTITPNMIEAVGGDEGLRLTREVFTVYDFDGDGKDEIIPHGNLAPRGDVLVLSVTAPFPGFAGITSLTGDVAARGETNGGDFVGGSFWNAFPADINGDGDLEIINHHWDKYAFWSIDFEGKNYTYPKVTDNDDAKAKGAYHTYTTGDAVSYFGAQAVDVDGDGKDEIVGTQYQNGHALAMISFPETVDEIYAWTNASQTENYKELFTSGEIAALAGNSVAELWPIVKGDVNQDGKDELYTGGGKGLNLVAIQYKGDGDVLDPANYDMNLVYDGEGGEVFATWEIRNGSAVYEIDSTFFPTDTWIVDTVTVGADSVRYDSTFYAADSYKFDTTGVVFDDSVIDTLQKEVPFTSYIFADNVDLDADGQLEIVLAEQSVYDSITVNVFDWVDTSGIGQWILNINESYKVFNDYRQSIRVLEYNGTTVGFKDQLLGIITPDDYKLEQNYPNPFNPSTTIRFSLPLDKKISLKVYDMVGQEVKSVISGKDFKKGNHQVVWDGTNNFGAKVASGHYIAKLTFGNFSKSIKMSLLK